MAFLGSILPSIGKFGSSVIKDIVTGKNVGESLKRRGLETIRNLPVLGELAEPLVEKAGEEVWKALMKPKTKKGKKRAKAIRKIFGGRLTPAGVQRAKVASKIITGKDYIKKIEQGTEPVDIIEDVITSTKKKGGRLTGSDAREIIEIVESMTRKNGRKKGKESARVKRDRAEREKYDKAHGIKK